jgi:hypothetical protein
MLFGRFHRNLRADAPAGAFARRGTYHERAGRRVKRAPTPSLNGRRFSWSLSLNSAFTQTAAFQCTPGTPLGLPWCLCPRARRPNEKNCVRVERAMDRSKWANNPECFDKKGRWKKGARMRVRSKRYQALTLKRREPERRLAAERKRRHGELANRFSVRAPRSKPKSCPMRAASAGFEPARGRGFALPHVTLGVRAGRSNNGATCTREARNAVAVAHLAAATVPRAVR